MKARVPDVYEIERDADGKPMICGRCSRADLAKGFCRVTARYVRSNTPTKKCRFFKENGRRREDGQEVSCS